MSSIAHPIEAGFNFIPAKILVSILSNQMPKTITYKMKFNIDSLPPLQSSRALAM